MSCWLAGKDRERAKSAVEPHNSTEMSDQCNPIRMLKSWQEAYAAPIAVSRRRDYGWGNLRSIAEMRVSLERSNRPRVDRVREGRLVRAAGSRDNRLRVRIGTHPTDPRTDQRGRKTPSPKTADETLVWPLPAFRPRRSAPVPSRYGRVTGCVPAGCDCVSASNARFQNEGLNSLPPDKECIRSWQSAALRDRFSST